LLYDLKEDSEIDVPAQLDLDQMTSSEENAAEKEEEVTSFHFQFPVEKNDEVAVAAIVAVGSFGGSFGEVPSKSLRRFGVSLAVTF